MVYVCQYISRKCVATHAMIKHSFIWRQEWSYLRGGLSTLDRDYGIFNKIHHDIGTHVVHHLFPQIPHYHLEEATAAVKPVMGDYYRCVFRKLHTAFLLYLNIVIHHLLSGVYDVLYV